MIGLGTLGRSLNLGLKFDVAEPPTYTLGPILDFPNAASMAVAEVLVELELVFRCSPIPNGSSGPEKPMS